MSKKDMHKNDKEKSLETQIQARIADPTKRWKLSPMDLQSRAS